MKTHNPDDIAGDFIIGIDGDQVAPWPTEYSRDFTLRLLNNDIQQPNERLAYFVLRDKHPALLREAMKRRERARLSTSVH